MSAKQPTGSGLKKVLDSILRPRKQAPAKPTREIYVKAIPLRSYDDVDVIKAEVRAGNIVISNVSPLARKSVEEVNRAVGELSEYMTMIGGDIARLGEERIVLTPPTVKIWRGQGQGEG